MLDRIDARIALHALLSLTLVRVVPVALALVGTRLSGPSVAFVGWFGPRGLASIVFGLTVLEELGGRAGEEILLVVTWTVSISVVAHGVTARPLTDLYARHCARRARAGTAGETAPMGPAAAVPSRHGPLPGTRSGPGPSPDGSSDPG